MQSVNKEQRTQELSDITLSGQNAQRPVVNIDQNVRHMTRAIVLTTTLVAASYFMGCAQQQDAEGSDGNVYNEQPADSVKTSSGRSVYYYGGRGYMHGATTPHGTTFHASPSGSGGYFAKPGISITPRGGFGGIGRGASGFHGSGT